MEAGYGYGKLAKHFGKVELPLQVLRSHAGFYIGTQMLDSESGWMMPFSRESIEYFPTEEAAHAALKSGQWTQKPSL